jgi:hypothetical protein
MIFFTIFVEVYSSPFFARIKLFLYVRSDCMIVYGFYRTYSLLANAKRRQRRLISFVVRAQGCAQVGKFGLSPCPARLRSGLARPVILEDAARPRKARMRTNFFFSNSNEKRMYKIT